MADEPNTNFTFKGYNSGQFLALMDLVEADGGQHVVGPCTPYEYPLEVQSISGRETRTMKTTGCGKEARFMVPYPSGDGGAPTMEMALVCAIDDAIGLWPRYNSIWEDNA